MQSTQLIQKDKKTKVRKLSTNNTSKLGLNFSCESTVQNNSLKQNHLLIKLNSNANTKTRTRQKEHIRQNSDLTYNFFINKSKIYPSTCKSNNTSMKLNDSLAGSSKEINISKKPNKLECYLRRNNYKVKTESSSSEIKMCVNNLLPKQNKPKHIPISLYDNLGKNRVYSPKIKKEVIVFKDYSMNNLSNLYNKKTILNNSSKGFCLTNINLNTEFKVEKCLFSLYLEIIDNGEIYSIIKSYIDIIQEKDLKNVLDMIKPKDMYSVYKNAFILERMSVMIIFYLFLYLKFHLF